MAISTHGAWLLVLSQFAATWAAEPVDFEREVRPLLTAHCVACHGADEQHSSLRLDARHGAFKGGDGGPVIRPGEADSSELLRRVASDDVSERMPPEGEPLDAQEIELLRRWIDQGAIWPETAYDRQAAIDPRRQHWAYQPLQPITPPRISEPQRRRFGAAENPIDAFIYRRLAAQNLEPSPPAARRVLLRRLVADLHGLAATPAQIEAFERDGRPDAWAQQIDSALASPRYGERWGQHWLDIVRYADTHGFEVNTPRENAWPYRDYVIRALNDDKPYRQFVREQLIGDQLHEDAATGFLVAAAALLPGQIGADDASKRLARQDELDEMIVGTTATFLGITVGCARCHDHKFDPVTQEDYYRMQAFFAGVRYGDRVMKDEQYAWRQDKVAQLQDEIRRLESQLRDHEPPAHLLQTLVIDETDEKRFVAYRSDNGQGINPEGTEPGYRDDPGDGQRFPNLSGGQYRWWDNEPGVDIAGYHPHVAGRFRLWLSWGVHGSGVHTRDARYLVDLDGDLTTQADQHELAQIDQYYRAGENEGQTPQQPLWSGLQEVDIVTLNENSQIVIRGGETGTGITADAIVLQGVPGSVHNENETESKEAVRWPRLRAPLNTRQNTERFEVQVAKFIRLVVLETLDQNRHEPCIDELEVFGPDNPTQNLALASAGGMATSSGDYDDPSQHQLRFVNDGVYGNQRSWISSQRGQGWVQIELPEVTRVHTVTWGRDRTGAFQDRLATRYRVEVSLDGQLWHEVANHQDRLPMGTPYDPVRAIRRHGTSDAHVLELADQLERRESEKRELEHETLVFAGMFQSPDVTHVLRRGDPEQPADEVAPGVPAVFAQRPLPADSSESDRRMALADWIVSPRNPLTARVMANRVWLYHFGHGLVATPSDFGVNGARPTHPELLDWLAGELIHSGWSLKHLHRLILTSATYQQSHELNPQGLAIDRGNRWLWHFPSRRLEAEAIRDTMLQLSGELNLTMGGSGFNFFKSRGGLNGFPPVEQFTPNEMRRMVYAHKVRMEPVPIFGSFDCPDAGQATPQRSQSTTPIQALSLMNNPFVLDRAASFADRIEDEKPESTEQQVTAAFRLALGRAPSQFELSTATGVVEEYGLITLCRVLFNSNEFLFLP